MNKQMLWNAFQWRKLGISGMIITLALLLLLVLVGNGATTSAQGTTIYVSTQGNDGNDCLSDTAPCQTITAALTKATNGDTIQVLSGTYPGGIVVDKSVAIRSVSAGAATIGGGNEQPWGFHISSSGVTIDGFVIRDFGKPTSGERGYGIYAPAPVSQVVISNNTISQATWAGIFAWSSGAGTFDDWTIQNNTIAMGNWSSNNYVYGIECTNCVRANISNNIISGAYVGLLVSAQTSGPAVIANGSTIANNQISNASFANLQLVSFPSSGATGIPTLQNIQVQGNTLVNDGSLSNQGNRAIIGYASGSGVMNNLTILNNTITIQQAVDHHTDIRAVSQLTMQGNQITINTPSSSMVGLSALKAGSGFVGVNLATPTISYNVINTNATDALSIYCTSCANPTIRNNVITVRNPIVQAVGWRNHVIDLYYASGSVNVLENHLDVQGSASGSQFIHGINIQGNGQSTFTVDRNYLGGVGTNGAGLRLRVPQDAKTTIQAKENAITWDYTCVLIDANLGAKTSINLSKLDCPVALESGPQQICNIDATENWWGHATGPTHTTNPDGQGNRLVDDGCASFSPWVNSNEDTDTETPGFQPVTGRGWLPVKRLAVYLPIVSKGTSLPVTETGPDLVISRFVLEPAGPNFQAGDPVRITVDVKNQGNEPASPFWVDLYINPSEVPTNAGVGWNELCSLNPCFGIAWAVDTTLEPGQSITLQSTSTSYYKDWTIWNGWFINGTTDLYAFADTWGGDRGIPVGGVKELDETNNLAHIAISVSGTNPPIPSMQWLNPFPRPVYPRSSSLTE